MPTHVSEPAQLKTEYFINPLGLGTRVPRFSWLLRDARAGTKQVRYHVQVGSGPGTSDLWDSGPVAGDQSVFVAYGGKPLQSCSCGYWRVKTWSADGSGAVVESGWSQEASFELGLLERGDFEATFIAADIVGTPRTSAPAPYFRKTFSISKPVAKARLYVTALGLHETLINGKKIGDHVLAPGWTEYRKRVQVHTYDVTAQLQQGENCLGAICGDGWYCGFVGYSGVRQIYGDRPKYLAQLEITHGDGSRTMIATDNTWRTSVGPIAVSDMQMGEVYDAALELGAWSSPGYDASRWLPVRTYEEKHLALDPARGPLCVRHEAIKPVSIKRTANWAGRSTFIVDFGQNLVGWLRLNIPAANPPGWRGVVSIKHVEKLSDDGKPYTTNLRAAKQIDEVMPVNGRAMTFEPRFTFHGFQYVEISGYPAEQLSEEDIRAVVVHSDMARTSTFECSEPLLNQLFHNIIWGQKGNFLDVPTDCPQRDERLGWTGDAQVFIRTAALNMDVSGFFNKWLQDIVDAQHENGAVPNVVPSHDRGMVWGAEADGGPAWADAGVICPWTIWLAYADRDAIARNYASMQRFIAYLDQTAKNDIRAYDGSGWQGFGDWLSTDASGNSCDGNTPKDLIGTAYYAYCARLLSKMAEALGKRDDAAKYAATFERVRGAFQKRFVTADGIVGNHNQTSYVLALHFDLLPQELRSNALAHLVTQIRKKNTHLTTGFVGTPYLLFALSDNGETEVALELLTQKTYPSWLYPVLNGATTIWERWDGWTKEKGFQDPGMNSFNHYAYGAVSQWMICRLAGLDYDETKPGGKHLLLRPTPPRPGSKVAITHARATLETPYGRAVSGWSVADGKLTMTFEVPANSSATLHGPDGTSETLSAGTHTRAIAWS